MACSEVARYCPGGLWFSDKWVTMRLRSFYVVSEMRYRSNVRIWGMSIAANKWSRTQASSWYLLPSGFPEVLQITFGILLIRIVRIICHGLGESHGIPIV